MASKPAEKQCAPACCDESRLERAQVASKQKPQRDREQRYSTNCLVDYARVTRNKGQWYGSVRVAVRKDRRFDAEDRPFEDQGRQGKQDRPFEASFEAQGKQDRPFEAQGKQGKQDRPFEASFEAQGKQGKQSRRGTGTFNTEVTLRKKRSGQAEERTQSTQSRADKKKRQSDSCGI